MKKSSPAQEEKTHKYIKPGVKIGNLSFFHFRPYLPVILHVYYIA